MNDYGYLYEDPSDSHEPELDATSASEPVSPPTQDVHEHASAAETPAYEERPEPESVPTYEAPAAESPLGSESTPQAALPEPERALPVPHAHSDRPASYEPVPAETVPPPEPDSQAASGDTPELVASAEADQPEPETAVELPPAPSLSERSRRLAFRRDRGEKPAKRSKEPKEKDKRAKKLVGLKIGASQIAAARVVNNGAPEVVEVVREPLEPGLVVAGEIRDAEALGAALQGFFERHKLPKKGVRLGIANNRIGVRVFEIEGVTEQLQLENAIRFRAEEVLPIPLDQAVLDHVVLEEGERPDGTPFRRILLVVAYREVVERYLEACHGAGLDVVGIDLEAFALLRSLAAPADRDQSQGALVAVAVGHDRTTIAVSTGRYCEFTRVIDWGGWSLNVAIARDLDRAPSEVEAIKRQLSFAEETTVEGLTPDKVAKTRDGVQRALAAFARELVASLHFYQAQPGAFGIGEIVVTGGTAHMDGFPEALGRLIGVSVHLGDPFSRVKATPDLGAIDNPGSVAVAVGLGIED
jgi:type IV pilus assembly protein PilM